MGVDGLPIYVVEHLQRIAKKEGFEEGYEVQHEAGSKVGDGFTATMLSIKLVGYRRTELNADPKLDELALICKLQPSNDARKETFGLDLLFQREVYSYNKLLPALLAFEKEHNFAKEFSFTSYPKCYEAFHEDGNCESVIFMEDLRPAGFELWKKSNPTTFESVRLVMEQIGRLHGLSIAIRNQKPDLFKEFEELPKHFLDQLLAPTFTAMIKSSYENAISMMDSSEDIESLQLIVKNLNQIIEDGLNGELLGNNGVIIHGDCWMNNMMFAMDKGFAKSVTLIDWQCARLSSPAIDLAYYLLSATEKPLRDAHLEEFLQIYYTNLANSIRATGSDPDVLFPEAELQRQLRQFGMYGIMMAPLLIPVILADSSEITNIEDMAETISKGTDDPVVLVKLTDIKLKKCAQRLKDVLGDARHYGWL